MKKMSAMAIVAVAGAATAASGAVTVFSTGFEAGEGYTAPANLTGQNGWVEASNITGTLLSTKFAVQNTAGQAYQGSQYVEANTAGWGASTTTTSGTKYRFSWLNASINPVDLAANPILHVSAAIRANSSAGANRNSIASLVVYGSDTSGLVVPVEVQIRARGAEAGDNSGQFVVFNSAAGIGFTPGVGGGSFLDSWNLIDIYLNYTTGLFSISLNGSSVDAALDFNGFNRSFDTTFNLLDADLAGYRTKTSAGGDTGGHVLRWDNYLVELIPAPSSVALMGLGGLLAARRRRA